MKDSNSRWLTHLPYYECSPFLPPAAKSAPNSRDFDDFEHEEELEPLFVNPRLRLFAATYPASAFFTMAEGARGLDDESEYENAKSLLREFCSQLEECLAHTGKTFLLLSEEEQKHYGFGLPRVPGFDCGANGRPSEEPLEPDDTQTEELLWFTPDELAASVPPMPMPVSLVGGGKMRPELEKYFDAFRNAPEEEREKLEAGYQRTMKKALKEAPGTQRELQAAFNVLAYSWGRLHGLRFLCYQLRQAGGREGISLPVEYAQELGRLVRETIKAADGASDQYAHAALLARNRKNRGLKKLMNVTPEEAASAYQQARESLRGLPATNMDAVERAIATLKAQGKLCPQRTDFLKLLADSKYSM